MADIEFHPRQTGSRDFVQPWGKQEVDPYSSEHEQMWLDWADRLALEQPKVAEEIVKSIVKREQGENDGTN